MNAFFILSRVARVVFIVYSAMLFVPLRAAATDQVLILNSYHQGMDWTDGEVAGLKSRLDRQNRPVELHIEYMDAKRLMDQTHIDNLRQLFAHKYESTRLKVIVVTDNDAFDFMRRYRDQLFPEVPVVFCGVNWFQDEQIKEFSGVTGVAETADSAATIRLMLRLHPNTKRIVVIIDNTTTGKALQRELEAVVRSYNGQVRFEFLNDIAPNDLIAPLSALSADDLVLLMPYASDPAGNFVAYPDIARLVTHNSPVPVYASWDFYLGYGITGGNLTSAKAQGSAAGELLIRILNGERADSIPVQRQTPGEYTFDDRQLARFNIPESLLPENSRIVFQPWHETNKTLIEVAALITVTLAVLLWALLVSMTHKRRADAALRESMTILQSHDGALHEISQGVLITGPDRRIRYANKAIENISGYSAQELLGKSCKLLQGPETSEETIREIRSALNAVKPFHGEILNYRKDGSTFWNALAITPVFDARGQLSQFVGVQNDVTMRRQVEVELRIAAKGFESQVAMLVADANGIILRVNPAFVEATGYSEDEAIGHKTSLLKSGRHDKAFYEQLWKTLQEQRYWHGVIWNRRKNGSIFAEWLTINAVVTPTGEITHYVGIFSDITQNKEAEAEVHRLAYYDQLTQFPNRRLLQDRLGQALALTARSTFYGAILFLDLDNFNTLNDTRGHDTGDLLLVQVAQRLRKAVRQSDTVARLGGDEFVVVLEDIGKDAADAAAKARNIGNHLATVIARPYDLKSVESSITTSIGLCLFNGEETVEQLLKNVEIAMYQAKADGRNTLRFFDPEMQTTLDKRSALENDLRQALGRDELRLFYQPQLDHSGRIIGAEALLRWEHPERGFISPGDFIPLAEETGLILPIGHWVLKSACEQIKTWSADVLTRDLRLSANVSSLQFRQDDFTSQVQGILADTGTESRCLKLELTETLVLDNVGSTIEKMQALKAIGVTFSMDDFGTGYSSLAYLTRLPLDELKIDKSFVSNLPGSHSDSVIAETIITMGRSLGLTVVAEGVESEAQRACLNLLGCHVYQGYLFSRPVPIDAFMSLLQRNQAA